METIGFPSFDANEQGKKTSLQGFIHFLSTKKLEDLGVTRESDLGKSLRVMRFLPILMKESLRYSLSPSMVAALAMTESYGDPGSINEHDGGAGLIHMQRTTVQLINNLISNKKFPHYKGPYFKTIATYPDYRLYFDERKGYIVDTQMANLLKDLMSKDDTMQSIGEKNGVDRFMSYDKLIAIDDRFDPTKSIQMACMYLDYCSKYVIAGYHKDTKGTGRSNYKSQFGEHLLKDYLIMNAFNKGPGNYTVDFTPSDTSTHIGRVISNYIAFSRFIKIIHQGISHSQSYEQILSTIIASGDIISKPSKTLSSGGIEKKIPHQTSFIQPGEFTYLRENSDGHDVYAYKVKKGGQTVAQIKKILVERFNKEQRLIVGIDETMIVDQDNKSLNDTIKIDKETVVYIVLPGVRERIKRKI